MICPYCCSQITEPSSDHIIPRFLSGRKTIQACKTCNSRFGHGFEGKAAQLLLPLYVLLAKWGVRLPEGNQWWRAAYELDGAKIDLAVGSDGVKARAIHPIIVKNESGEIREAYFDDNEQKEQFLRTIRKRKPDARWVSVEKRVETKLERLRLRFEIDSVLRQLTLKTCIAASTLLTATLQQDRKSAGEVLRSIPTIEPHPLVLNSFSRIDSIDSRRPPLSHSVYVEHRDRSLSGIMQFFGAFQLRCRLSTNTENDGSHAILGWADPISQRERFESMEPVGLPEPPPGYYAHELMSGTEEWWSLFCQYAMERGAVVTPELRLKTHLG